MDPTLALKIENKARAIQECSASLKQNKLTKADQEYTLKMKKQFLDEIKILTADHPELLHHPALLKIQSDL